MSSGSNGNDTPTQCTQNKEREREKMKLLFTHNYQQLFQSHNYICRAKIQWQQKRNENKKKFKYERAKRDSHKMYGFNLRQTHTFAYDSNSRWNLKIKKPDLMHAYETKSHIKYMQTCSLFRMRSALKKLLVFFARE